MEQAGFWLSPQQKHAWQLQQAHASRAVALISIAGAVDLLRLRAALRQLVCRHEILRTAFRRQTGMKVPFQVVLEDAAFQWEEAILSENSGTESRNLRSIFDAEQRRETDWEKGPAVRAVFIGAAPESSYLILSVPTLCADSRSFQVLLHELATLYDGKADLLTEPFRYVQFAQWQSDLLECDDDEDAVRGRKFWATRIPNGANTPPLPYEKQVERVEFRHQCFSTSPRNLSLAVPHDVQKTLTFFAAWQCLIYRLSGQSSFVAGYSADNREFEELQNSVGAFGRTLPLAVQIENTFSFSDVLRRASQTVSEAISVQEYFSPELIGVDGNVIGFSHSELSNSKTTNGLSFTLERVEVVSERFKLRLNVVERGSDLELEFHYDASRFERSAVERIAGYYQNLLRAALADPATRVSRLPLLSPAERHQMVVAWNQTAALYPKDKCLHQLFEAQAALTPERMAVRCGDETLSYRELNQRANQLAHYLRRQGVGPDHRVGLCLERSTEMMISVVGILKAGGAYVPLNADNPRARLKQQLEGATVLITESKFAAQMPEFTGTTVLIDGDEKLWASEPKSNPALNTTPENLVYVIYTSGSTGVPKGVAVRHRNLVNYADFISKKLQLSSHSEGLRFATVSTLGADLGNTCIYPSLISGGSLHVIPYETSTDPRRLADYLSRHPVDVLKIVPSHLQALLQAEEAARLLPRKYLIMGGEALTPKLLEKITSFAPTCEILNHYGPTETTVGSLTLELKDYDWRNSGLATIPIGRPIQNTQVYVLDQNLEPVPVGVTGELYIAGAGITSGYLGQPEKTAERFISNPFSDDPGAKMYRTGDLARYSEEGLVEFLGRGDDQVKIRGFRIELGEIEAVLARHAAVKQAVVLARSADAQDAASEKRLLAYVVLHRDASMNGHATSADDLRHHLQQHVPDHMVPQAVVILPKLPLNANGKLDRQALPEPEQVAQRTYVAPRTATEQTIAEIWAEVLRRDKNQISADDNFFDLGGHSLLATQVVSRLRRALNIDLPLRTLFESPTVAALAEQIAKFAGSSQPELPPIIRVPRNQPLPLSFAQQRLWVLDRMEPNNPLYNIPRAMRLKGRLNVPALLDSLNEIVRRHESQRTTFAAGQDGQPVQIISESLKLNVPLIDLTNTPAATREAAARNVAGEEARTPFDLSTGPLLRAKLLRLDAEEHVLLLTMHHIVSDAWSSAIFFRELGEIYAAFSQGRTSPVPELEIQYADYAAWQRRVLQGAVLENQLRYWREHLRGAPPLLQLPADRPHPQARTFAGAYEPIPFSSDTGNRVKTFSQQHSVTPFMTMLAAFNALLARLSGQERIVLGTDMANRTTAETERLIGFFINLLPLHADLSGDPTFEDLVARIRGVALGAYAHQDVPFDKLVEDLQPERSTSHNPIVQALFVMQNIPAQGRELPGLEMSPFATSITHSKFDVGVFIRESGGATFQDWLYSTELFDRGTILRLASSYETLLTHALSQPNARLSTLEIYTREEKTRLEAEKNERKRAQRNKLLAVKPEAVRHSAEETKANS